MKTRDINEPTEKFRRLAMKKAAFDELETLRRKIPDLDYDSELAAYRDEKFGSTKDFCNIVDMNGKEN